MSPDQIMRGIQADLRLTRRLRKEIDRINVDLPVTTSHLQALLRAIVDQHAQSLRLLGCVLGLDADRCAETPRASQPRARRDRR